MGFGKSFKKAWKKTVGAVIKPVEKVVKEVAKPVEQVTKAVANPVEQAAKSSSKLITRGAESFVRRTGMEGTFVGDAINAAARAVTLPRQLVGGAAAIVGGESAKDVGKSLLVEIARSTLMGERQYRKMEKAARQSAEAAAYQRKIDEETALAQAMAKKKAMLAEQESQKARPITDSYLSAGGTLGGYVDAEELKKKKKLGGGK